jgi:hypothetical protein
MSLIQRDEEDISMKLGKAKRASPSTARWESWYLMMRGGRMSYTNWQMAYEIYEKGAKTVMEEGKKYAEEVRVRMRQADTADKQAKEKMSERGKSRKQG